MRRLLRKAKKLLLGSTLMFMVLLAVDFATRTQFGWSVKSIIKSGVKNIGKGQTVNRDGKIHAKNQQAGDLGSRDALERDVRDEVWRLSKAQHEGHKNNTSGVNDERINGLAVVLIKKSPGRSGCIDTSKEGTEKEGRRKIAGKVEESSGLKSENGTDELTRSKSENRTQGSTNEKFAQDIKRYSNETRHNNRTFNHPAGPFQHSAKPKCPLKPRGLLERVLVDMIVIKEKPLAAKNGGAVQFGGFWKPKNCDPIAKVAILIPYRKRPEQLRVFLNHMHPVMQRQMLEYRMFVVEQAGNITFNKGAIYNIGFNETLSYDDYDCYIFHDIDLLSENDFNSYACPESPRHMSVAIDKFGYRLPYSQLFGGIEAFKKKDFQAINGFSNTFWGWGGEDDNLFQRIAAKKMKLTRPNAMVGKYKMNQLHHYRRDHYNVKNSIRVKAAISGGVRKTMVIDGLNTIHTLEFDVYVENFPLYTRILINLDGWK